MTSQKAPDGGYGWIVVAAAFFISALLDGLFSVHGVLFPYLVQYYDVGRGQVAVISSVMAACLLLSGPIVSVLVGYLGCRLVAVSGGLLCTLGLLLSAFSTGTSTLTVYFGVLTGLGLGMMYLPAIVFVGLYFERRRGLASGIATAGSGVGMLLMAPASAYVLRHYEWRTCLVSVAALALQSVVASALLRPLTEIYSKDCRLADGQEQDDDMHKNVSVDKRYDEHCDDSAIDSLLSRQQDTQNLQKIGDFNKTIKVSYQNAKSNENNIHKESYSTDMINQKYAQNKPVPSNIKKETPAFMRLKAKSSECVHSAQIISETKLLQSDFALNRRSTSSSKPLHIAIDNPVLMRKDIFYSGSIQNLLKTVDKEPQNKEPHEDISNAQIVEQAPLPYKSTDFIAKLCTELSALVDFGLCANAEFLLIATALGLWQMGYLIPTILILDYCEFVGIPETSSTFLLSLSGGLMIIGRTAGGALGNLGNVNPVSVSVGAQVFASCACALVPFCESLISIAFCVAIIGVMLGPIVPLTTVYLVDSLGVGRLTSAVGVISLVKGVTCFLGTPIAGLLLDWTGGYKAPFMFGASTYLACGICLYALRLLKSHRRKRSNVTNAASA